MENLMYNFVIVEKDSEIALVIRDTLKKFKEFNHISEIDIITIRNNKKKANIENMDKGEATYATISKISPKIKEIIEQITGENFIYILEIVNSEFDQLDLNQQKAIIYFELAKITQEYKISKNENNSWLKIIHGIGIDFKRLDQTCVDILDPNFTWEKCLGTFFKQLAD